MSRRPARWLAAVVIGAAVLTSFAAPAAAHLAIRVDIQAPVQGQRVGPNTDVVLMAQPMLAGVAHTAVSVVLDGHPIDPATGAIANRPTPVDVTLLASRRIALRRLIAGTHTIGISYRPDVDEPLVTSSVTFVVVSKRFPTLVVVMVVLGAALAVGLLATGVRHRRRGGDNTSSA